MDDFITLYDKNNKKCEGYYLFTEFSDVLYDDMMVKILLKDSDDLIYTKTRSFRFKIKRRRFEIVRYVANDFPMYYDDRNYIKMICKMGTLQDYHEMGYLKG